MTIDDEWGFATNAVRTGQSRTEEGEHAEAIFPTSSFVFGSAAEAAARFSGEEPGNIYSRFTNPTVRIFEQRLAALEGGEACVATASGMSAIMSVCLGLLRSGDHIVSSRGIFGSTTMLFNKYLGRFDIRTSYVSLHDLTAWQDAIGSETRLLFLETPSNPLAELGDITALADLAHANGCLLVVDNSLCTPVIQRPLELGADLVIHSATKYLDGQGRCVGGAVVGGADLVGGEVFGVLRTVGPTMSPFNAWVFLKGLETLALRMRRHSENAMELAGWLQEQPMVERVYYPGLDSHPQHKLAREQQVLPGGILSFEVKGGREEAWNLIDSTRMLSITANLGDTKSTITHPASTTHGRLSAYERKVSGIKDNLIRMSVGLEEVEDIKSDLSRGLRS